MREFLIAFGHTARSAFIGVCVALAYSCLMYGCAGAPDIQVNCPPLRTWSQADQNKLAEALLPIPSSSPIWDLERDWQAGRDAIRACQKITTTK